MLSNSRCAVVALAIAAVGCGPSLATVATSSGPVAADTSVAGKSMTARLDAGAAPWQADEVHALGFTPLAGDRLPSGTREIRVWTGGGLSAEETLYRIFEKGGSVRGEEIISWPTDSVSMHRFVNSADLDWEHELSYAAVVRHTRTGQCRSFLLSRVNEMCVLRFARKVDWRTVLRRLDADSVMTLPDQRLSPIHYPLRLDGWDLTVEVLNETMVRRYGYFFPLAQSTWAPERHAAAIATVLWATDSAVAPSAPQRRYQGRWTPGPHGGAFRPCGSRVDWGIEGSFGPSHRLFAIDSIPAEERDSTSPELNDSTSKYIEAIGRVGYPELPKLWGLPFPKVLEADSVTAVRPWTGTCG